MEFERTEDIIEHARAFHRELGEFYMRMSQGAEKRRLRLLLDYLGRHEQFIDRQLARFEQHARREILDTWFQYVPEDDMRRGFRPFALRRDMDVDDIVEMALALDEQLVSLFRETANRSLSPAVREILGALIEVEKEAEARLARTVSDLKRM